MNPAPDNEPADEPQLPPRLAGAFKALGHGLLAIPAETDDAVLEAARRKFRVITLPPVAPVQKKSRLAPWLAAAAALALGFVIVQQRMNRPSALAMRADVDGDGRVDVLDAFQLARRLEQGGAVEPKFDLNGDGVVDQKDVDVASAQAVALEVGL